MEYRALYQPTHTIIGKGALGKIAGYICGISGRRAMIISDSDLVRLGTVKKVTEVLEQAALPYVVFDQVAPNPTVAVVNEAFQKYQSQNCDYLIGIGGGSSLDVAKAVSILATNGGRIEEYNGTDKSRLAGAPLVAVNTTAGSGSEATRAYVITNETQKIKMLMVDEHCLAYLAVNDPELMIDMPPALTAATGMDALTHAIEAYVSQSRFPYTDALALEAIRLISSSLRRAVEDGRNIDARTDMCWAEYMAGLAFSNAGLGMVHAMAHQLGGFYNTPHGVANAILLPYVMRFNLPCSKSRYGNIATAFGVKTAGMSVDQAAQTAIVQVEKLAAAIKIPRLKETAFRPEDVAKLSIHAMEDTAMPENPRQASISDVKAVFLEAYNAPRIFL